MSMRGMAETYRFAQSGGGLGGDDFGDETGLAGQPFEQRTGLAGALELDRVGALDEGESLTEISRAGLVGHDDDHVFDRTEARPRQETSLRF
jgi:hypothetical protein